MTAIKEFDKVSCRRIEDRIVAELQETAKALGLSIERGGGNFDKTEFKMKLKITITDAAAIEAAARATFTKYCSLFDLLPEHFGCTVSVNGKTLVVAGLAMNRTAYPVRMRDAATGKVSDYRDTLVRLIKEQNPTIGAKQNSAG